MEDEDKKLPAATVGQPKLAEDDDDNSDVELEGMDMDEDDATPDDDDADDDDANAAIDADREDSPDHLQHENEDKQHEQEDLQELEAARQERMELMAEELKREKEQQEQQQLPDIDPNSKFQFLIGQSEVFAHFLAGASAAADKKKKRKKGGSRGKANRMTEAEEDAQLLATANTHRRTVYLNQQPKILAEHCKMHKYQLEGLNWMIKLHDHGINGILADEVRFIICVLSVIYFRCTLYIHAVFFQSDGVGKDTPNNLPPSLSPRGTWRERSPPCHCSQICRGELD